LRGDGSEFNIQGLGIFPWTNLGDWLNLRLRQLSKAVYRGSIPEEIDNW
jgi:hypothetical protein